MLGMIQDWVKMNFGEAAVVIATVSAMILKMILPKDVEQFHRFFIHIRYNEKNDVIWREMSEEKSR